MTLTFAGVLLFMPEGQRWNTEQELEVMAFTLKVASKPVEQASGGASNDSTPKEKPTGFLKTGAAAVKMMQQADAEAKARKEQSGKAWRFFMKAGEDAHITFLDGVIDQTTGILDIPYANEHRLKIDGKWTDLICTEDQEPCPICAAGERKAFVGYLTILDHREREYDDKDGKKVTVPVTRRLFVAKSETLKQLTKMASKREGSLIGYTFEVSRTGDKKAAVGDMFDEVAKHEPEDIKEAFPALYEPLNYADELPYHTAAELDSLGLGKKVATIGSKSFGGTKADAVDADTPPW